MKLDEIVLTEITLQAAVKKLLKPAGTLSKVMGRDAQAAATLLRGKPGDDAFTLTDETPMSAQMLKSISHGSPYETADSDDHDELRLMRMPGGAKLLVVNGEDGKIFVVTTALNKDELVEARAVV